ncbi:neurotrophin 1-like [Hylaeus anthracinus]|uniref:neurotrophin 1-like n=1 Tax=Hylaeus anthracinus TaxID=313031 RepID=UPI0023B920CA|nr:neurotrophin 1-like [Hylaeus anthracinus]
MEGKRGPILTLAKLCLLIVLIVHNVYAYPYPVNQKEKDTNFNKSRAKKQGEKFVEKLFDKDESLASEEWSDSNDGRPTRRVQRDTSDTSSKSLARSFISQHKGSSSQEMQSDGKIVFPGETNNQVPVCKGSTYCEKINSYPRDLVTTAIHRNETLKYLAGVDVLSDIEQRIDPMDDTPLCVSTEQVIFPQSAENKENQWKYIANQENFKQGVRIEKCSKENVSCNVIGNLAEGYTTKCKQKYVYRQLAAVLSDGTVVPDTFKFPSSCCCHVSFVGNPYTRMGVIGGVEKSQFTPVKTRRRK